MTKVSVAVSVAVSIAVSVAIAVPLARLVVSSLSSCVQARARSR